MTIHRIHFDLGGIRTLDAIEHECRMAGINDRAVITSVRSIVASGAGDVHSVLDAMNNGVIYVSNINDTNVVRWQGASWKEILSKQDSEEINWAKEGF